MSLIIVDNFYEDYFGKGLEDGRLFQVFFFSTHDNNGSASTKSSTEWYFNV